MSSMCYGVLCLVAQCVWLFATPWTAARQAPLSMGILQARILAWIAMPSSRGSSQPRDWTQGLNPGLPHCRQILYHLSHQGSPRILEWVAYPFSRGTSQPRNRAGVSWIAGGFFTSWATREAQWVLQRQIKPGGAQEMRGEQDSQHVKYIHQGRLH